MPIIRSDQPMSEEQKKELEYIYALKRSLKYLKTPPGPFSEKGLCDVCEVLVEMMGAIQQVMDSLQRNQDAKEALRFTKPLRREEEAGEEGRKS